MEARIPFMYKIGRFYTAYCFLFVSIACFALGLTAHAFAFTNLFPTHDSLYNQYLTHLSIFIRSLSVVFVFLYMSN